MLFDPDAAKALKTSFWKPGNTKSLLREELKS